jgi:pseudomonalisin
VLRRACLLPEWHGIEHQMNLRPFLSMTVLATCILASSSNMVDATESWVPTETHAADASNATPGPAMRPDEPLHIAVTMRLRNKEEFDMLTSDVQAGRVPPLTPAEFKSRFAPTADQVNAVTAYLGKCGFTHIAMSDNNLQISADGTAQAAATAFNVELRHFNVNGRDVYANVGDAQVPAALGDIVQSVQGLQNIHMARILR